MGIIDLSGGDLQSYIRGKQQPHGGFSTASNLNLGLTATACVAGLVTACLALSDADRLDDANAAAAKAAAAQKQVPKEQHTHRDWFIVLVVLFSILTALTLGEVVMRLVKNGQALHREIRVAR